MKAGHIACVVAGFILLGCSSLSEVEKAEQTLAIRKADLNATRHEIGQIGTRLLLLPKDSPPILDLSRLKDQLDFKLGNLQKGVSEAEILLAALKETSAVANAQKPDEPTPTLVSPSTIPGEPAVDPETGLPAATTPTPEPPVPTPEPPVPTPEPPVPVPEFPIPPPPGTSTPIPAPVTPPPTAVQVPGLRVGKFSVLKNTNTGLKHVVGDLHNEAKQSFSKIRVEFRLYDAGGKIIGTTSDTRFTQLAPATVWPFQSLVKEAKAERAELVGVSILK